MATADRKLASINSILSNDTYQTDSGLYQRLEEHLNRLPADTLADLGMLVFAKWNDAYRQGKADAEAAEQGRKEMLAASYGPTPLG